jgi:hypothetical protein
MMLHVLTKNVPGGFFTANFRAVNVFVIHMIEINNPYADASSRGKPFVVMYFLK